MLTYPNKLLCIKLDVLFRACLVLADEFFFNYIFFMLFLLTFQVLELGRFRHKFCKR